MAAIPLFDCLELGRIKAKHVCTTSQLAALTLIFLLVRGLVVVGTDSTEILNPESLILWTAIGRRKDLIPPGY